MTSIAPAKMPITRLSMPTMNIHALFDAASAFTKAFVALSRASCG